MTVVYREHIPSTDPRLARHVHHDDRSRLYAFPTAGLSIQTVRHTRRIPVLDQGQLGSCTGNAGIGCLGTDPYFETLTPDRTVVGLPSDGRFFGVRYSLDEVGAVRLYSDATKLDDAPGQYPPDDTGSDGLSIAKALKAAGEISGYQHTFTLDDALKALSQYPLITGIRWYENMFTPAPDGLVTPGGKLAGGHEIVVDEYDGQTDRVGFTNSWGTGWGVGGRFYMRATDWAELLSEQGDVTVFVPLTQPAPVPPSPVDADAALAAVARPWIAHRHVTEPNRHMAAALKAWLAAKNL